MKTFHKPEWYSTIKLSRERNELLRKYFKTNITYSKDEIAMLIGPMYTEFFLPALGSSGGSESSIMEACRFKDMPRKKITNPIDRSISDFSVSYEDENDNKKDTIDKVEPVDFLIIDDEED